MGCRSFLKELQAGMKGYFWIKLEIRSADQIWEPKELTLNQ